MCTNRGLVDNLECYMDDLVDCFDDFIKKSLIIVSVAIGALVIMLVYVLKIVTERPQVAHTTTGNESNISLQNTGLSFSHNTDIRSNILQSAKSSKNSMKNNTEVHSPEQSCKRTTSANTDTSPSESSLDESVLRNMGFSNCSKGCMPNKKSITRNNSSDTRITTPSLPTCILSNPVPLSEPCQEYVPNRGSCCSMCCDDDN
ncbi:uncharacterized protein LOC116413001 isoform X1 [Galleria mellonella]|uniref:Uncharacterized protein LOC116413001 isoform X1 n=1 Tax=Galleria mellonella TaxID=7137 RepID=A0A6J3BY87_GALME|nr:uncharacterized protein LOC116413001 isoform X1 [Galleria mellonella]XP_052752394.1 uncharacterized protein LOC116413001 isoform X1 [Galleria mellonella]